MSEALNTRRAAGPQLIADFDAVAATRIEPVGLVYLWPDTA